MSINFSELKQKMEKAGSTGASKLNMRNEDKQVKEQPRRFPHLKKEKKKKSKLLFVKEIAIPFNPVTGEADEFNRSKKWRPPYSVQASMKLAKGFASANPKSKETFMHYAGVKEWDVSNPDVLTETDYKIFNRYLTARIFSIPVVHVTIPTMCDNVYGKDYAVYVEIDPLTGEYKGDIPIILQAHKFFIEMAYEELAEYNNKIKLGEIKHDEKQQKEARSEIFSKVLISDLHPINFSQCFEIPLNSKYNIEDPDFLNTVTAEELNRNIVLVRVNLAISDLLSKFDGGDYESIDTYPEYYVADMSCPADTEVPTELGKRTTYEKEMLPLSSNSSYSHFREAVIDNLDNIENLEETVFRSSFVSKYDSHVEERVLTACKSIIDTKSPYFTKKVIESNLNFLTLALGSEMDDILAEIDCGISDKSEGNLDPNAAKKASKTYDIASKLDSLDNFDIAEEDEVSVSVDEVSIK